MTVTPDFVTDFSFSFKLLDENGVMRAYRSFEEKVRTYLDTITAPAMAAYPQATPLRGITVKAAAQGSPLRFPDTMSSRYHINEFHRSCAERRWRSSALAGRAPISSISLRARIWQQIALFDDDKVHVHTIFRLPGFIPGPSASSRSKRSRSNMVNGMQGSSR